MQRKRSGVDTLSSKIIIDFELFTSENTASYFKQFKHTFNLLENIKRNSFRSILLYGQGGTQKLNFSLTEGKLLTWEALLVIEISYPIILHSDIIICLKPYKSLV